MASDTSLVFNLVARERVSDALATVKEKFATAGAMAGKALGAGFAVTSAAAIGTAVTAIVSGAAAARAAVAAFQLAAQPQLESVAEAWQLYQAKQEAAAAGGEEAKAAAQAYKDALAEMTPATRDTAVAFVGLKKDFTSWSDSLSGTTMPVFTKGIGILREMLPTLTPFVKAAATALGGFLDEVATGVKSAGFKDWAAGMAAVAGPALSDFLTVIKNLAMGFGNLLAAFAPSAAGVTGGLVEMSASFAQWSASLQGSEKFAQFLAFAEDGGQTLGNLAGAAMDLGIALAPLMGTTAVLLTLFADLISSVPTPVLTALATTFVAARVGMKLYSAAATVAAARTKLLESAALSSTRTWVRSAATSTAAMARTAASATATAARTAAAWTAAAARATATWLATIIRVAAVTAARFVMMAARAVAWAAVMAAQWLIAMGPVGWITAAVIALVVLIIANWDKIKAATINAWNWVWTKIKQFAGFIWNLFLNWTIVGRVIKHWDAIKAGTQAAWNAVVDWVKKIPGRLVSLFLNWTIVGRVIKHWDAIKRGTIRISMSLVGWVRGLPGRLVRALGNLGSLLYNKGQSVVSGLWRGIRSMGGWLRSTLMGWARSIVPDPIADALGIGSPSTVLADEVGRWVPAGISMGVTANLDQVRAAARAAADAAVPPRPVSVATAPAARPRTQPLTGPGTHQTVRLVIDVTGGDAAFVDWFRELVRVRGGGSVQQLAEG